MAGEFPALAILVFAACANAGTMPQAQPYDTIVIGLGSSGVTAATTLARAGKRVLGLEAQNRIGGRVNTVPFGDGFVELGAEWIHGTEKSRVYDLAIANNISVLPQELAFEVFRSDGTLADQDLVNELMTFCINVIEGSPKDPEPLGHFVTRKLKDYLREKKPEVLNDTDFLEQFLDFMNLLMDNYEASNDWNDVSAWTKYEELGGHQHMSWHKYGYKTFFEILLNKYNNGPGLPTLETKLNTEVTQIVWPQDSNDNVVVTCKDGAVYTASNVIVTVSLGVLKERHTTLFSPQLPQEKQDAIDKISFGVEDKVILLFPFSWWKRIGWVGFLWRGEDKKKVMAEDVWTTRIEGVSYPMSMNNTMTFWLSGDSGKTSLKGGTLGFHPYVADLPAIRTKKFASSFIMRTAKEWNALPADLFPEQYNLGLFKARVNRHFSRHSTLFSPKLPKEKIAAIENISMGLIDKIVVSFPKVWWPKNVSFYAFLWRGDDKKKVGKDDQWTTTIFGASSPLGSNNSLTLWTNGEMAKLVETLPEDVVKRKCMELLRKFMGANTTIPEPTGILRSTWFTNPYTRGSYTYDNLLVPQYPHARADLGKPLLDSAGTPRVLFAGEATDETHFSTVHGASDTGYREASRLLPSSKI